MGRFAEFIFRQPDMAMYLLNEPADIKHVLVTHQQQYLKGPVPPAESHIFGHGVLHTEGELHHHRRRILLPAFHRDQVMDYAHLIASKAMAMADRWPDGSTIDVTHEMTQLTLSIIWMLLFGEDVGPAAAQVADSVTVGTRLITKQYHSPLALLTPLWLPTPTHRTFARHTRRLDDIVRSIIRERRSHRRTRADLLGLLLAATDSHGRPLNDDAIRDELVTLLLAGHETTANALTWTWWLVAQHHGAYTRVAQEVSTHVGHRLPGTADLPRLTYTKMVWDEALRLYPPAWLLHTRVAQEEDRLPSGVLLHTGASVFLSPWSMHRHARWFPEPHRFAPERFSADATAARPPYCYFPFGGGGHRCLGESFAELEGMLILSTVIKAARLRLVEGPPILPDPLMTLRPNRPVLMTVQRVGVRP
ncbi:cytochrome P450 [Nitrospira sp.]|nr:cytochrome P450 [Nitrospira sp.]